MNLNFRKPFKNFVSRVTYHIFFKTCFGYYMKRASNINNQVRNKIMKGTNTQVLKTPEKSKSDKKNYRLIQLENGIKALLINHKIEATSCFDDTLINKSITDHDDDVSESSESSELENEREKLSAVALAVGTGSFNDPEDIQGLAHFVEHMIFMGSGKYPKENELDQYLNATGGGSNALTECEHTLFYFDVVEEYLSEAMDRFSSLFVEPLMLRDSMSREIQAVESEFQNNINDDDNRLVQLFASKAKGKPSTFTWGNLKSLEEETNSDKLYSAAHAFRSKYYVANNMYLSIESSETLDNLQKLVENFFSGVKSGHLIKNNSSTANEFFIDAFYNKIMYVKPKEDKCKLRLTFVMPSMHDFYMFKPHDYLAYIIQHEGCGSLSSFLKRNLLAFHVSAGSEDLSFEGNSLFTLFGVEILLTEKGFENIEIALEAIFSVLLMLRSTSSDEHERCFNELKQIRDTSFRYEEEKSSGENTEEYAVNMIYYKSEHIITGPKKFFDYNTNLVDQLIEILNSGRFNITILTDKHHQYPLVERWFGTEYDETDIPERIQNLWSRRKLSTDFFMPLPNNFICSKFEIVHKETDLPNVILPEKLIDATNVVLWFKQDNKFHLPHGFINCYFESPMTLKSARNAVLTSMYAIIVKHYLAEELYPAICAGLGYSVNAAEKGLLIKLSGYNEKLLLLLDIITKELSHIAAKIEPKVFETYREQCRRNGYNNLINSKFLCKDLRLTIVEDQHKFCLDLYNTTNVVSFEELIQFAKEFPKEICVKMMVLGNFDKDKAIEAAALFQNNLKITKNINRIDLISRARKIPNETTSVIYAKSFLLDDKNSIITNYYQIGKNTIRLQCLTEFIENLMQEPLFDILRTKEQLGYSVSCSNRVNNGIIGFTISVQVQENKNPTVFVNQRIDTFLNEDFNTILSNLTADEFEVNQSSLIKLKLMEEVEMENENNRLWSEITSDEYIFTRLELEAEMIRKLTLTEVQNFYTNIFLNAAKLSVQVVGTSEKNGEPQHNNTPALTLLHIPTDNAKVITNINAFKESLGIFEPWKTQINS